MSDSDETPFVGVALIQGSQRRLMMRIWFMTACVMAAGMGAAQATTLTTLFSFNNTNGADPQGGLIEDSSGNLFGTTLGGGSNGLGAGTVFELAKGASSYTFKTLTTFNRTNGRNPFGGLVADSSGNLYGTTASGGALFEGNVFKLTKGASTYTLSTLATFTGSGNGSGPTSTLLLDGSGNLFGTTGNGGPSGYGTAFELVKGAAAVTTLAAFDNSVGGHPFDGLIMDSSGNLFGTTNIGGPGGAGTVFELAKAGSSYTLSTLASFNVTNGSNPYGGLIMDGSGNLFGTTPYGGANHAGTVFELAKGASSYTLSTLASFNTTNGANPDGGLIEDSFGNLFGTTLAGGTSGNGTVFELTNGGSGYALNTVVSFNSTNGATPYDGLLVDSSGNLFGTTSAGGASNKGTVFEIGGSGYGVDAGGTVPEPASWALLAGGLLAGATWRRRKGGLKLPARGFDSSRLGRFYTSGPID